MPLTTLLARDIESGVKGRGRAYFLGGRVNVVAGDAWHVEARVQGSRTYTVDLWRDPHAVYAHCDCPYYVEYEANCKHIWAVLLAAERKGHLAPEGDDHPQHLLPRIPDDDGAAALDDDDGDDDYAYDDHDGDAEDDGFDLEDEEELDEDDLDLGLAAGLGSADRGRRSAPNPRPSQQMAAYWAAKRKSQPGKPGRDTGWRAALRQVVAAGLASADVDTRRWPPRAELLYVIDAAETLHQTVATGLAVDVALHVPRKDGSPGRLKLFGLERRQLRSLAPEDRRIVAALLGASLRSQPYAYGSTYGAAPSRFALAPALAGELVPQMCRTGRCRLRAGTGQGELTTLHWQDGEPWRFEIELGAQTAGHGHLIRGLLTRGDERVDLAACALLVAGGLAFWPDRVARLDDGNAFSWIGALREQGALPVPARDLDAFLDAAAAASQWPLLRLPPAIGIAVVAGAPVPGLKLTPQAASHWRQALVCGELTFGYDGRSVAAASGQGALFDRDGKKIHVRDRPAEQRQRERALELGFRPDSYRGTDLVIAANKIPRVVHTLVDEGWQVEATNQLLRRPGDLHLEVSSGIDWFDLDCRIEYGATSARLTEVLEALRRKEQWVKLDDGSLGLLPEQWLEKNRVLLALGSRHDDKLRFTHCQAILLDALLAAQPDAEIDELFARVRDELRSFDGVKPADAPTGFVGQLREYQRDGLGWLLFLQRFGFGGCLADDMGLGKTVQVLALLEMRRAAGAGTSLVVVPRSLVFNWIAEAARFAPALRVLDYSGIDREHKRAVFGGHDVILATYGTLRRDAGTLKDFRFDCCILDEAQAIKNSGTQAAKAARLVQASHRLALSGTPVENHLGELWSLFEFLNPGMLGTAGAFKRVDPSGRSLDDQSRDLIARGLRPFILRRTKGQVATDLPEKLEQTLYCQLEGPQRALYDELRDHYRRSLLPRVRAGGVKRETMHVLEALLRLRQAACHPGLVDPTQIKGPSAKLEQLEARVDEALDEGHKVLVFSQFTSLLAIVRDRLDDRGISYEYLDGQTRDRQQRVERFQTDPACRLFLISLKAGGLGLNLTAADYVFLLDPWWNPAVETQAIDRTHRIGQDKRVFAYRLIARDTVEEKVLELQQRKRALADAIIGADRSVLRDIAVEDLELLLS